MVTEARKQWQWSAKHEGTTRAHPDNLKNENEKIFCASCGLGRCYMPLCTAFGSVATPVQNSCFWP